MWPWRCSCRWRCCWRGWLASLRELACDEALAQGGGRDVSALMAAGRLNEYTATVQAGLLIVRNPHLLD